jgi:hypothetical protein
MGFMSADRAGVWLPFAPAVVLAGELALAALLHAGHRIRTGASHYSRLRESAARFAEVRQFRSTGSSGFFR